MIKADALKLFYRYLNQKGSKYTHSKDQNLVQWYEVSPKFIYLLSPGHYSKIPIAVMDKSNRQDVRWTIPSLLSTAQNVSVHQTNLGHFHTLLTADPDNSKAR